MTTQTSKPNPSPAAPPIEPPTKPPTKQSTKPPEEHASSHSEEAPITVEPDRTRLWMAAIKPPMYCVAVMPICVGSAVAYVQTGLFQWGVFLTFSLSAVLLLMWENLTNDVFDAETGIDQNKHHSLVNLTRNRSLIFGLGTAALAFGVLGIVAIALWQQDVTVLAMVLSCCLLGYLYQGPPFRLGYQGLGEILCFLSFGPLAVGAAYYSQVQSWAVSAGQVGQVPLTQAQIQAQIWQAWSWQQPLLPAALMVGISTTLVLFCSHFHQVKDDLNAGKKSPIVRLGTLRGAQLLPWACGGIGIIWAIAAASGGLPWSTLLLWGSAPAAVRLCQHVLAFHNQPAKVSNAKFLAIHFHAWSGLLLMSGLLLSTVG